MSSLINYIPPIKRKLIIKNNLNKYKITSYLENYKTKKEPNEFLDIHNHKKMFQKIEDNFFLNKNILNYSTNHLFKKTINQKKVNIRLFEK